MPIVECLAYGRDCAHLAPYAGKLVDAQAVITLRVTQFIKATQPPGSFWVRYASDIEHPDADPLLLMRCVKHLGGSCHIVLWRDQLWTTPDWQTMLDPGIGGFSRFTIPLVRRLYGKTP